MNRGQRRMNSPLQSFLSSYLRPMTIICTVTNDLSYDQRMIRICSSLVGAGHEVVLVGRKKKGSKPLVKRPFRQKRLNCFFQKGKFFYLEYNLRLFFFLLFRRYDTVCSVDLDTILPGFFVSKWKGKTCVYDAHEYFTETPEIIRRPGIKAIWEWVGRMTVPRIQSCYTVGEGLADLLGKKYGTSFEVIRNVPFLQQEILPEVEKPVRPVILYQGALNEGRALEECIEAMQWVDGAELWLAGEGDLSEALRAMVVRLQLTEKVKFLGYKQPEELKMITAQASIGLNVLHNLGLSYYYSLANKAFDYIQAGIPSIHMDFPEYLKLNEQYQVFVLVEDVAPRTIAATINDLLEDQEKYDQLRQNALRAAKELTWEVEEKKLLDFYGKLFDKNHKRIHPDNHLKG